jgi:hypothetical protein
MENEQKSRSEKWSTKGGENKPDRRRLSLSSSASLVADRRRSPRGASPQKEKPKKPEAACRCRRRVPPIVARRLALKEKQITASGS